MKNRESTKSHGEEYTEGAKDETGKKVQRGCGSKYEVAVHANTINTMFEYICYLLRIINETEENVY